MRTYFIFIYQVNPVIPSKIFFSLWHKGVSLSFLPASRIYFLMKDPPVWPFYDAVHDEKHFEGFADPQDNGPDVFAVIKTIDDRRGERHIPEGFQPVSDSKDIAEQEKGETDVKG